MALNLDIPYLWIDCLCIVQDDAVEWSLEAPKMGSIYNGSIVTIAATSAASGHDGLFNTHSSSVMLPDPDLEIVLDSRLSCGSSSILRITRTDIFLHDTALWIDHIEKAPLMQRAWVCQERMSSPRIIHYTSAQLFWECEHCNLSEDNDILSSSGVATDARPRRLLLTLYQSQASEVWDVASTNDSWSHPLNQWYSDFIGSRYSQCSLTFAQDKLIAISGLAKLIHDRTSIPYFAGHWFPNEHWFLRSLRWQRNSAGAKTRAHRAPSWSWASQDSAVMFSDMGIGTIAKTLHSRLVHLSMIDAKAPAPAPAPLGSLCVGEVELILEGPLLPLKLEHIPYTFTWEVQDHAHRRDSGPDVHYLDNDTEPSSDTAPYALALDSLDSDGFHPWRVVYFLIPEEIESAETTGTTTTMKRLGFGITSTGREWGRGLLVAPMKRVRIL